MVIESRTTTDDIIITSLPKTMAKMHFLLNWSHCVKRYGHFCQILALLTIPDHQIWSCHMTQDAHFENLYFDLILHLISGKVTKFLVEKLSILEVISKKPHWKTPPPPVPLGLNVYTFFDSHSIWFQSNISLFQAIPSSNQVIFKNYGLN